MSDTPEQASILIIEDEVDMARILEFNLSERGYAVAVAHRAGAALEATQETQPDLILLDLRLPDMFGIDLLKQLKADARLASTPVIIVSALGDEATVVQGLNLGASDYVTKPFRINELMARVASALRRPSSTMPDGDREQISASGITVDPARREVLAGQKSVDLTRSEFDLLAHFVHNPGRVFTRHQLCHQALGAGTTVQERTIDAHIRTIRRKLGEAGSRLATVWGIGYKLESTAFPSSPAHSGES